MVLEAEDEEIIKFRHQATFDKAAGLLVVTNVRAHWSSNNGDVADFQTPWANVAKTQYCEPAKMKGKAGIKLDLHAGARKSAMFMLTGSKRAEQLEVLRPIVRELTTNKRPLGGTVDASAPGISGSGASASASSGTSSGSSSSGQKRRTQLMLDSHSDSAVRDSVLYARRTELLQSDATLARHHRELCEGPVPILSEEEFWEAHMPDCAAELYRRDGDDYGQRGRVALKGRAFVGSGSDKFSLSRDDIVHILEEEPETLRAYQDLVPHQKTEKEFWQLYVDKYYHRTVRSGQADQLFARYERKVQSQHSFKAPAANTASTTTAPAASGFGAAGGKATLGSATGHWREDSALSLLDSLADADHPERLDAEDACHAFPDSLHKMVQDSRVIASAGGQGQAVSQLAAAGREKEYAMSELQTAKAPAYVPLKLHNPNPSGTSADANESACKATAAAAPAACGGFGKKPAAAAAASGISGSGGGFGRAAPARGSMRAGAKRPFPSAQALLASLDDSVPAAKRASDYFSSSRALLQSRTDNTRRKRSGGSLSAALEMQRDIDAFGLEAEEAPLPTVDLTAAKAQALLSPHFRQETQDAFAVIVEYLRHLYSLLARARTNGAEPSVFDKIGKILAHLDLTFQKLVAKKAKHRVDTSVSAAEREAAVQVVDELLKMVSRARTVYKVHAKQK